ncbi:MAG: WD40 repeat domain-containing protein, partial [Planctomycetaceae bacterium]
NIAASSGANPTVAAAVADARSGRAVLWQLQASNGRWEFAPVGDFIAHAAPVLSVAVSNDGNRVASADGAGRVYLWSRNGVLPLDYGAAIDTALDRISRQPGRERKIAPKRTEFTSLTDTEHPFGTLKLVGQEDAPAHSDAVRALDFSADGRLLVSSADDFTVKVWDGMTGNHVETLRGHGGWVRSVVFSPVDNDVVLSAGYDRSVKSWRLSKYSEALVVNTALTEMPPPAGSSDVQAHDDEVWSAHFSRDGSRIVTTSRDQTARLWTVVSQGGQMQVRGPTVLTDRNDSQGPRTLAEGSRHVTLAFQATPDGRTLMIGSADGTIHLFDVRRGTELGEITGCGLNNGFAISDDGRCLLTAASEPNVSAYLWDLKGDAVPTSPNLKLAGHEHPVTAFAISADGQTLYTGDQKGIGQLWNRADGKPIGESLTYHNGLRINDACFLADGRLVTGSDDLSVVLYDPRTKQVEQQLQLPGFVTMLTLHPDQRQLLAIAERAAGESRQTVTSLVRIDLSTSSTRTLLESTQDGPKAQIRSARFSADGRRMITAHGGYDAPESFLRLWESSGSSPRLSRTLRLPKLLPAPDAAILLPDQTYELVTLHGAAAYQWSLQDLEHHQSYRAHGAVTDAGFTSDGRFVATCSRESVKIWDADSGKPLFKLEAPHNGSVTSVEFSPRANSYEFVTAGTDGVAKTWIWDPQQQQVEPGKTFAAAKSSAIAVRDAVYSGNGGHLLTCGDDGLLQLWDVSNAKLLANLIDSRAPRSNYLCGTFSANGQQVVAGSSDKLARLWNIDAEHLGAESNPPMAVMAGHADQIAAVAFLPTLPNDRTLRVLTASRDRSARAWDALTGREVISLRKHSLGLTAVDATQVGPQGDTLVLTAGLDGRLILWPSGS